MNRLQNFIFRHYEQRRLRDWFYTVAFLIFVPVGFRFASLAWRYGYWVDKPLALIAGLFIGITTVVTLMRVWSVPPRQTTTPAPPNPPAIPAQPAVPAADEFLMAASYRAARNRALAAGARALGSTPRGTWHRQPASGVW
jgi:hypothetical protein